MKRALFLLVAVCVAAGFAGRWLAWDHAVARQSDAAEQEKRSALVKAKKTAEYFAGLARDADEVRISYYISREKREVRVSDPAWLSRLAAVIGHASCTPTAPGLWMSTPEIGLYRKNEEQLNLMMNGRVLRALLAPETKQGSGDFIVGQETVDAIFALAKENEPDQAPADPPEPTPTSRGG